MPVGIFNFYNRRVLSSFSWRFLLGTDQKTIAEMFARDADNLRWAIIPERNLCVAKDGYGYVCLGFCARFTENLMLLRCFQIDKPWNISRHIW